MSAQLEEGGGELGVVNVNLCQLFCVEYHNCYFHIILCTFTQTLWVVSPARQTLGLRHSAVRAEQQAKKNPPGTGE